MVRKSGILVLCMALFLIASPVFAQEPQPQHDDPFWQVWYWNNVTLSGVPQWAGQEQTLAYDWGDGSPRTVVQADDFSARWSRYIELTEAGTYRFTATGDDGIRVMVDGQVVVDGWYDHPAKTFSGDVALTVGHHLVVVEYYEKTGSAVAKVTWTGPLPAQSDGWRGEYFDNRSLSGSPSAVRYDPRISFPWGYGPPVDGLPSDHFSVRWTHTLYFEPGTYRFTVRSDDGARLWVNDHLLIDAWYDQAYDAHAGTIYLAGNVPIKLE